LSASRGDLSFNAGRVCTADDYDLRRYRQEIRVRGIIGTQAIEDLIDDLPGLSVIMLSVVVVAGREFLSASPSFATEILRWHHPTELRT
jgi:hypothetical protein